MQTGSVGLTNIGQLVTNDPARGGLLGLVGDAAIVIESGEVAWVGSSNGDARSPRCDRLQRQRGASRLCRPTHPCRLCW